MSHLSKCIHGMECNNYKAVANSNVPSSNITYQAVEDVADPEEDDLDHLDGTATFSIYRMLSENSNRYA